MPKRSYVTYRDADPDLQAEMDKLLTGFEGSPGQLETVSAFGKDELAQFRLAVLALENFLADPTSSEAPQQTKEGLRLQYLRAAQGVSLVLGAGAEALRRYDAEYIPEALERYNEDQEALNATYLTCVATRREELAGRIAEIELPERTDDFVKGAVMRIEAAEAFKRSVSNGLPLEVAITVRKSPLKLVMPKVPGAA
ncbi:MAG: hypothetical protein ACAH83_07160 [Alphaproteobacteria bacterium]